MNRNLRIGLAAILVVVVAAIIVYVLIPKRGGTGETIDIAANLPLSGDLAIFGTAIRDGAIMALQDLEKANPSGPKLVFDWQDNAGSPQNAVSIMQQQFLRSPEIYTSGLKPQAMAIIDQVTAKGIPHFVWIFDAYVNRGGTKNNFRTLVNYKLEAPKYVEYAKTQNARKIAILYINLPHTEEEFQQLVIPELKKLGIEVYAEAYDLGLESYSNLALKVRDFGPDVIILNGFPDTLAGIVRALRPLGLIKDGNTIATYDMLDVGNFLGADELEGIRVVAPAFVTKDDTAIQQWRQRFQAQFNRNPWYINAFGYDMVQIIYDAAKHLTLPATGQQWIQALRATNVQGITGPLKFDDDGSLITPVVIVKFQGGKLVATEQ